MMPGPIAGSVEILAEIKTLGTRLYCLTNFSAETYPPTFERFEFLRWFRGVLVQILVEILLPQIAGVMTVALVLAFVTMLSVLSVPIMISGGSPTMITVDMAFRVNSYSDYGVANALGFISYLIAGLAAWIYVRHNVAGQAAG